MGGIYEMTYVGHNHFSAKDKSRIYNVIQVLYNTEDTQRFTNVATLINIFVNDEDYKKFSHYDIGTVIKVEVKPVLTTGKVSYKLVS